MVVRLSLRTRGHSRNHEGAAILFDPHSPEDLSEAILKMTCEPELRRIFVDRGLIRARDFTWERAAHETIDVFREVI